VVAGAAHAAYAPTLQRRERAPAGECLPHPCDAREVRAGWTFRKSGGLEVRREGCATIYGVPYSEHSNFEARPLQGLRARSRGSEPRSMPETGDWDACCLNGLPVGVTW